MNLSITPDSRDTSAPSRPKSVLRKLTTCSGVIRSLILVKLRTSVNSTVSSQFSPPSRTLR